MHFVLYRPLKHKLRTNSLSDREALPYLIIYAVLFSLGSYTEAERLSNGYDIVSLCLSVIIVIGGTYYAYRQNGGKEGFNLVQKYLILAWVVAIRFTIVLTPVVIVYVVVWQKLGMPDLDFYNVSFSAAVKFIYYHRLGRHIRDTRETVTVE